MSTASPKADQKHKRTVLTELIEEIQVDTTPSKNKVKEILGGPFTFLGQYPDEKTVVMALKQIPNNLQSLSIHELRELCKDNSIDTANMIEKQELVDALVDSIPPLNPHVLQPPLDKKRVRGDILIMRVADTEEPLDEEGGEDKEVKVMSNEEFFLDYTKEEYVMFASRTDVVAPEPPEPEEEDAEDESEGEDEEEDEDFELGEDDEETEEEEKQAMLNLVMNEVLKKFREENGRGPDTEELLELRSQIASQLGVEVASVATILGDESERSKKRPASENGDEPPLSPKKVKFSGTDSSSDDKGGKPAESPEDKKPPAAET